MVSLRVCRAPEIGFHFPNYYDYSVPIKLPFGRSRELGPILYGLCGGMCYAALDYYHAGLPVPGQTRVPQPGEGLYRYLWKRQMDSLQLPMGPMRIFRWMFRSDEAVARTTVEEEFPGLQDSIGRGQPAVLLMIYTGAWESPTQNHQVVAVGYDLDEATQRATIPIYDPNYPGKEPTLRLDLRPPFTTLEQSTGEPLRGFFLQNYRPKRKGLQDL